MVTAATVAGLAVLVTVAATGDAYATSADGSDMMIAVADAYNGRVQVFYPDGTFAFEFGTELTRPSDVAIGPNGSIVVHDDYHNNIYVFHPNGTHAFELGAHSGGNAPLGKIGYPEAVAVAPDGKITVGEENRVQVFRPDGTFALAFGSHGRGADVFNVGDVAVAPDGRIAVLEGRFGINPNDVRIFHPNGTSSSSFNVLQYFYWSSGDVAPDGKIVLVRNSDPPSNVYIYHLNGTRASQFTHNGPGLTDVAVASDGKIVTSSSNHSVQVFHPNGTLALRFGSYGSVQGGFDSPTDAAVAPDGRIVVAEPGSRSIRVFYPNGTFEFSFGSHSSGDEGFYVPREVAVAPDGRIVVGDTGKHRIQVFNPDGTPALAFGSHGTGETEFRDLGDVAVAPDGRIVAVAQPLNGHIKVFYPNGTPALVFEAGYGVSDLAIAPDGKIVVSNDGPDGKRIQVFHPNGTSAFTIPDLTGPVAVAPDGRIVVGDTSKDLIQVFNSNGSFVFASTIDVNVASIAVAPDGRIVMVDDAANRVQVFNPNGTFAFSLLPDLSEGKFNGARAVAVGPLTPPAVAAPVPLSVVLEQGVGGSGPLNFTSVGDVANLTINVAGLAGPGGPPLNGSETSTVVFPPSETTVAASFAEVSFPPRVTASHVPAGGLLALRVATDVPAAEQVQEALGNGSAIVLLQRVVEVGAEGARITFDLPVRISLEGQAEGRAFYIDGINGTITPIDMACTSDNDSNAVHRQLGGTGECQVDSADGSDKIIYTYHLTKFGTVEFVGLAPQPVVAGEVLLPAPVNGTNGTAVPPPLTVVPPAPVNDTNGTAVPPPLTVVPPVATPGGGESYAEPDGKSGMIAVADHNNHRIQVFRYDGTFAFEFGRGILDYPVDVAVAPDGQIVVSSSSNIRVFNPDGTYAFRLGSNYGGSALGDIGSVYDIAVAPDGTIVVGERNRIQVFHANGSFVRAFGSHGGDSDGFELTSVAVAPDGRIVVGDRRNATSDWDWGNDGQVWTNPGHIRVFDPDGTHAFSFAVNGTTSANPVPLGLAVAPDGRIVAGLSNGNFQVFRPDGTLAHKFHAGPGLQYQTPYVAVTPGGRIVVSGYDNHTVRVFNPDGTPVMRFGSYGSVQGGFDSPTDAAVAPDGRIVVAEPGGRSIRVFHSNGTFAFSFGSHSSGDEGFYTPRKVAVAPDGRIVVADTGKQRVQVFNPDGTPALAFGSRGHGDREFYDLADVAVAPDGKIVVSDSGNNRVQVFRPDGTPVLTIPVDQPGTVDVAPDGRIVVSDYDRYYGNSRIHVFHQDGTPSLEIPVDQLGAVAVAPDGRIVVADTGNSRIHVFNPYGSFVFASPIDVDVAAIAAGPDGRIVVVDDGDNRVQVFNPDGTYEFSLLPDQSEGKFDRPTGVAVGPLTPPTAVAPVSVPVVIEQGGGGGGLHDFTNVGDAANVTIDLAGLARPDGPPLNGSESSTVIFPPSETTVATSFVEVTFPPSVTASHVPAGGLLALRVATDVPAAEQVQEALGEDGSMIVLLQRVVEVGAEGARITFDLPVRISLKGQAEGRAFYIDGADGAITPIDEECQAVDDADEVHRQLGGTGECQIDSYDGDAKIVYTYHLTKFGTVESDGPAPQPVIYPTILAPPACSVQLGASAFSMSASPGKLSDAVVQYVYNSGTMQLAQVELEATPWHNTPVGSAALASQPGMVLPASLTEVAKVTFLADGTLDMGNFAALVNGTTVARGLEAGEYEWLSFRLDLTSHDDVEGGNLDQYVTYVAQCNQ